MVDNAEKFNNYLIFAHFGGRFDVNILIRDVISKDPNAVVSKKGTTELNGGWLSFGVYIGKSYIEFRDSYKLF